MQIRWNLILNDSWEKTLNQTLVTRSLAMAGGSVSIGIPSSHCQMKGTTELIYRSVVFSIGPGRNIAPVYLWIACAVSLAAFDIEKCVDGFGNVIEPEIGYSYGGIR